MSCAIVLYNFLRNYRIWGEPSGGDETPNERFFVFQTFPMKIEKFRHDEWIIISILTVTMNAAAPGGTPPPRRISN